MTPSLQLPAAVPGERTRAQQRARDWAEIQERMLVPLYEAVHGRLEVGPATSVLGLGCGSGLSLLLAAARGAQVAGLEPAPERRELAEARGLPMLAAQDASAHAVVTVFDGLAAAPDPLALARSAARLTARGGYVVLATWGPRERCESAPVLALARRLADPLLRQLPDPFALSAPGAVERVALGAGLRPDGGGLVPCPFAYPDLDSAVRGFLASGWFDAALAFSGEKQLRKELTEALFPYLREDGTLRMHNVFRYALGQRLR